eukprot:1876062-Amphidinium_carterae.1
MTNVPTAQAHPDAARSSQTWTSKLSVATPRHFNPISPNTARASKPRKEHLQTIELELLVMKLGSMFWQLHSGTYMLSHLFELSVCAELAAATMLA